MPLIFSSGNDDGVAEMTKELPPKGSISKPMALMFSRYLLTILVSPGVSSTDIGSRRNWHSLLLFFI